MSAEAIKNSTRTRKVGLLILNASDWSRKVHEGIAAYAQEVQNWYCWLQPRGLTEIVDFNSSWVGDGIIGRFADPEKTAAILKLGFPVVNISWHGEHSTQLPKVNSDQQACGRLCAEYYLNRGFEHIGYVGPQLHLKYQDKIGPAAKDVCQQQGASFHAYHPDQTEISPDLDDHRQWFDSWVLNLPKPIGIITWSAIIAREIAISCKNLNIDIPNEVALVAVEHDPLLSSLSPMPIAHVLQRPHTVGYEAAQLLDQMIDGKPAPDKPILIQPEGIAETISTNTMFARDEIVSQAIRYIQDNINQPIQVPDIARKLNVSRRSLEDKFRKVLNRSPAEEIRNSRVNELKKQLRHSQLSLGEIAFSCGFSYQEVMIRFFKKETGLTPSEYRRQERDQVYKA